MCLPDFYFVSSLETINNPGFVPMLLDLNLTKKNGPAIHSLNLNQ